MQLDTFVPPTREDGDRVPAKEMVGRPLIVQVREHRTGVKTQYNSNPQDTARYKPEGGEAVLLDVADLSSNTVYLNVLWFNGAVVDSLKGYVAHTLPVRLFYDSPKSGGNGNPYLNVEPLAGAELAAAHQWATSNPDRFERERAARQAQAQAAAAGTTGGMPPIPGAPSQPPVWAQQPITVPPTATAPTTAQPVTPLPSTPPPPPFTPPASPPAPAGAGGVDPNDPAIQALLAQLAAQSK